MLTAIEAFAKILASAVSPQEALVVWLRESLPRLAETIPGCAEITAVLQNDENGEFVVMASSRPTAASPASAHNLNVKETTRTDFGATSVVKKPVRTASGIPGHVIFILQPAADVALQNQFVDFVAMVVSHRFEMASAVKRLKRLSTIDPLTAVNNRLGLAEAVSGIRDISSVAALYLDIDHFKKINDTHGHEIGDKVLEEVASVLAGEARSDDVVARLGGEEFVILLRGVDKPEALRVAERIRKQISARTFSELALPVTVSIGVALCTSSQSVDETISAADGELLQAKRLGRNRVSMYEGCDR